MQIVHSQHHQIDPQTGQEVYTAPDWLSAKDWGAPFTSDYDPDAAYERHLEDRGWQETEAHDRWEAERGVIQFADAYAQSMGYASAEDRKLAEQAKPATLAPSPALRKWLNFGKDPEG